MPLHEIGRPVLRWALFAALLAVSLGAARAVYVEPREREIRRLKAELGTLRGQLGDLRGGIEAMETWSLEKPGLDPLVGRARTARPAATMVASFLDALGPIGAGRVVKTQRIDPSGAPGTEVVDDPAGGPLALRRIDLRFRLRGSYHDLGGYLRDVEDLDQYVVVRSVSIRSEPGIYPELIADATFRIYGTP
jgi:Tfp pilus assembly protein PilO